MTIFLIFVALFLLMIYNLKITRKTPMKTLYIIRGIPGSGKSTLADKMAVDAHINYTETDQFLYNDKGEYEWTQDRLSRAIDLCYDAVYMKVNKEDPIIITTGVYSRWRAMRDYVELAHKNGYSVHIIECKGEFQSIHGVLPERLEKMKQNFIPNAGLPQMMNIQYSTYCP